MIPLYAPALDGLFFHTTNNYTFSRQLAHRTEVLKQNLDPEWKVFEVNVKLLCGGDLNNEFLIECFDYDNDGG